MKYDIYISYSRKDIEFVRKLRIILLSCGYTCWVDIDTLNQGNVFYTQILRIIDNSTLFIFVSSKDSLNSQWITSELMYAREQGKMILPICIDDCRNNLFGRLLGNYNFVDLSKEQDSQIIEQCIYKELKSIFNRKGVKLTPEQKQLNIEEAEERLNGPRDYMPQKIDVDVFISYRRVDGRDFARNIEQGLKLVGFPKVFFDFNSLRDGVFNTQIIDAIYSCKDFVLVLSPLALKNCAKEGDWVAKEIRLALKYNKHIIPVVIEDTFKGWPEDFPKDLDPIKNIQFSKLMTDEYFPDSIDRIAGRLSTIVTTQGTLSSLASVPIEQSELTFLYKVKTNKECRLFIDDKEIRQLGAGKLEKVVLSKGEYVRKVIEINNQDNYDEAVLILDQDRVELISLPNKSKGIFRWLLGFLGVSK